MSKGKDWKTPLGYYERAISELTKTRQELREELQRVRTQIVDFQQHLSSLQAELSTTRERLALAEHKLQELPAEITQKESLRLEQGNWEGIAKKTPNWSLLEGEGERCYRTYILFSESFSRPPQVIVSLSYFDIINTANSRLSVKVSSIDLRGFSFEIYTYSDTKVWGVGVNWFAYGF